MPTAREIQILLTIQANAQAAQTVNSALQRISKEAQQVGRQLERAFSPRLIQSQQQLQQQLFASAKALQAWLAQGSDVTRLAPALEKATQLAAARMIELSTATNVSVKDLQALQAQFAAITPAAQGSAGVIQQVTTSLGAMAPAMEKVTREMGSFTPNATNAQRAGQGLILSFSLSQAAAGNFSQALFGLGFSLLFVGPQMLNLVTISTALGAALGAIAIEKLTAHFKSETVPVTQKVADNMKEIVEDIAELHGETELTVREFEKLAEAGEGQEALTVTQKEVIKQLLRMDVAASAAAREIIDGSFQAVLSLRQLNISVREAEQVLVYMGGQGVVSQEELAEEFFKMGMSATAAGQAAEAALEGVERAAASARAEVGALISARLQSQADTAALDVLTAPLDQIEADINRSFEIQREATAAAGQAGNQAASQARQERIRLLRRALDDELDVHRAHIDQIKDVLSERLDVIKAASDEEIRLIREAVEDVIVVRRRALQDSLDDMGDAADARIDAVKDAADKELDLNKERIDTLKEQERELADALKDLARRRQDAIRDVLTTEEELAALEEIRRQQGDDPTLQREIALREARLHALLEEQDAIDEQTDLLEDQLKSMEDLIEAAEDRADQIKDNRDAAIDAIKDELAEAQKAARRRSEDEIRAIQRTRDADIRAARDAADARMDVEREAADVRIGQIEDRIERLRRASQDEIAGIQAAARASSSAASAQRRADRDRQQAANDYIASLIEIQRQQFANMGFVRDTILPELRRAHADSLIDLITATVEILERFGVPQSMWGSVIGGGAIGGAAGGAGGMGGLPFMQTGGRVPGAVGEPRLAVVHGGETVESGQTTKAGRGGVSAAGVLTVVLEATGQSISSAEMRKLKSTLNREFGKDIEVHLRSRRLIA